MDHDEIAGHLWDPSGEPVKPKDYDPDGLLTEEMEDLDTEKAKEQSQALLEQSRQELIAAQELLYATGKYAVLIELQGRDADLDVRLADRAARFVDHLLGDHAPRLDRDRGRRSPLRTSFPWRTWRNRG